jgi:ABC-type transporter Mla MlaB component
MVEVRVEPVSSGEVHLVLRGRLDHDGATRLRAALSALLNEGRYHTVGLDLREIDGLDEAGMATLAVARRVCAVAGVRWRLAPVSAPASGRPAGMDGGSWQLRPRGAADVAAIGVG